MKLTEVLSMLGGIGLFLYGMTLMSTGLKNAAGDRLRQILERVAAAGTNFQPGSEYRYSNTGYNLLGYILEDVWGKSYAEIVNEQIISLLDLRHTRFSEAVDPQRGDARSYTLLDNWQVQPETDASVAIGAGALASTPADIARFGEALVGDVFGNLYGKDALADIAVCKETAYLMLKPKLTVELLGIRRHACLRQRAVGTLDGEHAYGCGNACTGLLGTLQFSTYQTGFLPGCGIAHIIHILSLHDSFHIAEPIVDTAAYLHRYKIVTLGPRPKSCVTNLEHALHLALGDEFFAVLLFLRVGRRCLLTWGRGYHRQYCRAETAKGLHTLGGDDELDVAVVFLNSIDKAVGQ